VRQDERVLYGVLHRIVPPLLRAIWRPHVTGLENLPRSGPLILASNHQSFIDSVVIPAVTPRPVSFLAKSDYFEGRGIKGAFVKAWFEIFGALPVDRDDSRSAIASLDTALGVLAEGGAFGIYPEGTRSRDGRLYRGRAGVAQLALTSGAPVIPVGLIDTDRLQPVGSNRPRLVRITVKFGDPIDVRGRYDGVPAGKARREITDAVMAEIQKLTGQEYVPRYAPPKPSII
jgi:1-acyl-sn-glycerol-3-phosphate acyltransferase